MSHIAGQALATRSLSALGGMLRRYTHESLYRNSLFIMATTALNSAFGYLYWIIAARSFNTHDIGTASALISAVILVSLLSNLGVGSTLVQLLPTRPSGVRWAATINTGLLLGFSSGLIGGVGLIIAVPFFLHYSGSEPYTLYSSALLVLAVPLWNLCLILDNIFTAELSSGKALIRNLAFILLKILLLLPPFVISMKGKQDGLGLLLLLFSWIFSSLLSVFVGLALVVRLRRGYSITLKPLRTQVKLLWSRSFSHYLINLGSSTPMYILPVLVATRLSVTDNAYFYLTWMLGNVFFMVSPAVALALFAEGSQAHLGLGQQVRKSLTLTLLLLVPVIAFFMLAGRLMLTIFGPSYPNHGYILLCLLAVSSVPDAITNIFVSVLRINLHLTSALLLNMCMGILAVALSWFLLPLLGIAAVGWSWLAAQCCGSLFVGLRVLRFQDFAKKKEVGEALVIS